MANDDPPSSIYEHKIELMGSSSLNHTHFSQRPATFLNHATKSFDKPPPVFKPTSQSNPQFFFKLWKPPPTKWAEWVDRMAGKHSAVWIKSGIFDSIMNSIYEIPCNRDLISKLSRFWTPKSNTFVFPWGEATVSLEDVMILGGFSVLGDPVDEGVVSISITDLDLDLAGKVEVMKELRSELVKSRSKKASHSKWIQKFMKNEHEHEIEHIAFLSLWLSRFVFPSGDQDSVGKHVFAIAARLSRGVKLALAPAVLAYIYRSLTRLKEESVDSNSSRCVNLLGPFQLVQIWGYERFPTVGPKSPNELRPGEPRLARWHALKPNVNVSLLLEGFIWRPYAVDLQNWKQPFYYQDSDQILSDLLTLDDDLKSFVRFITPCELDGVGCKAKYHPHRVAMQFGYDQDIPGHVSYKSSKVVNFFVPSRSFRPGVSKRYSDWWKNVDQVDIQKDQDSSLDERMNASVECREFDQKGCDKSCDFDCVDLTLDDGFDDVLVSLKKICNATKRKIDSLKESSVGAPRSKKLGSDRVDVVIID